MRSTKSASAIFTLALLSAGNLAWAKETISYAGGDGSSKEKAVIIKGADDEEDGMSAEYEYLHKKSPGFKLGSQTLEHDNDRSYDVLEFMTAKGEKMTIYFDITEFFGKSVDD